MIAIYCYNWPGSSANSIFLHYSQTPKTHGFTQELQGAITKSEADLKATKLEAVDDLLLEMCIWIILFFIHMGYIQNYTNIIIIYIYSYIWLYTYIYIHMIWYNHILYTCICINIDTVENHEIPKNGGRHHQDQAATDMRSKEQVGGHSFNDI